jgi:hypothetical protein
MRYIAIKVKTTGNERQKKRNKVEKEERNEMKRERRSSRLRVKFKGLSK